ncbi:MAG: alanine racemase [Bacteroidota bacterium]
MNDIIKPTLLLDIDKMVANLDLMISKSQSSGLVFRPHFKTHQSQAIGGYYRERGVQEITVSSLDMASYFVEAGWTDITVAFPANLLQKDLIAVLHSKAKINLISDDVGVIQALDDLALDGLGLLIEVDTGYHRTGVDVNDQSLLDDLVRAASSVQHLTWKGFLVHNGHSYKCRGQEEIIDNHDHATQSLSSLQSYKRDFPDIKISLGDTPSFSVLEKFAGFDEMRPGNFVFYDLAQWQIGSCDLSQIAVCMACPIVAKYPDRGEVVVYGGGVHFSKDRINWSGKDIFGFPVGLNDKGWTMPDLGGYVSSLSQEHGIIKLPDNQSSQYKIGDLIGVLPVHSCLTADAMKSYTSLDGKLLDHL